MTEWLIYVGTSEPHDGIERLPPPPSWRTFDGGPLVESPTSVDDVAERRLGAAERAVTYRPSSEEVELVNAALYLRRPLLVTGKPGTGKSTLAHSIARELKLGPVLTWFITSKSVRQEGLYSYDALARLRDASLSGESRVSASGDIGRYIRMGPLGTALLPYGRPRVLLIDELDKSDIDLPSDLLTIFEEGEYEIPELLRISSDLPRATVQTYDGDVVSIAGGRVKCQEFPLVIITSNGERDFPPPFLRRCLQLELKQPTPERLTAIVRAHLGDEEAEQSEDLIATFLERSRTGDLATDQLLNAIYLRFHKAWEGDKELLVKSVLQYLNSTGV